MERKGVENLGVKRRSVAEASEGKLQWRRKSVRRRGEEREEGSGRSWAYNRRGRDQ